MSMNAKKFNCPTNDLFLFYLFSAKFFLYLLIMEFERLQVI